ncbi:hypothetical protein HHS34_000990 [Acidithiobacillus montserratensis]|uniref:Uncharacterized protein n=1 Tax=Acidithiobacillus montserratensis TaxID=2729135 RepID=A0ACD5HIS2_9PROT|nr:hypothetical protein [Acidithiobacillus montserratensis]MBN2678877.1 hypothetical protein [Acidithiobacillaceae bacterium]MBU2749174.1 hypothetical protein [Acidithiobacillus montserratensis]
MPRNILLQALLFSAMGMLLPILAQRGFPARLINKDEISSVVCSYIYNRLKIQYAF